MNSYTFLVVDGVAGVRMAWPRIGGWYDLLLPLFHVFDFDLRCNCHCTLVLLLPTISLCFFKTMLFLHTSAVLLMNMPFTMEDISYLSSCCYTLKQSHQYIHSSSSSSSFFIHSTIFGFMHTTSKFSCDYSYSHI